MPTKRTRRAVLRFGGVFGGAAIATSLAAACGAPTGSDRAQPAATVAQSSAPAATAAPKVELTWWHHWAEEDSKKRVITRFIDDYRQAKPNVTLNIQWWQKAEMYPV